MRFVLTLTTGVTAIETIPHTVVGGHIQIVPPTGRARGFIAFAHTFFRYLLPNFISIVFKQIISIVFGLLHSRVRC
ncbi:MAG: hypothetical protein KatS3mg054_0183 [Chloroflexus sp.]|nr:MAG: hypothetical protein KatS3mg054_0183 [Chloroflexus sp.]